MPRQFEHSRITQLSPATGWWVVYASTARSPEPVLWRECVPAFALVESWASSALHACAPGPRDGTGYLVAPMDRHGERADETSNYLGLVHESEWPERRAHFEQQAQAYRAQHGLAVFVADAEVPHVCH